MIGRLGETDGFLAEALRSAATKEPMAAREALGEMASDIFYVHPRHMHKRRLFSVDEPAPTVRSTYSRPVPHDYAPIANDAKSLSAPFKLTRDQVSSLQGFPLSFDWSAVGLGDRDKLVANAVPVAFASALATVILQRHRGLSQPMLEREFSKWLRDLGYAQSTIDDHRTKTNKGRRLLGGRIYSDIALEIAELESSIEFRAMSPKTQSAVRVALRLHSEFRQKATISKSNTV